MTRGERFRNRLSVTYVTVRIASWVCRERCPYDARVSTRKLILTAMACGMAILLAGGVFLFRTLGNKDALTVNTAVLGETRSINSIEVTVVSWRRTEGQIHATVKVATRAPQAPIAKADIGWTMLVGVQLSPVAPVGLQPGEASCNGSSYEPGKPSICVLSFADAKGTPYLAYSLDAKQVQWVLAA